MVVNILGVSVEAWKIDSESKSATKLWNIFGSIYPKFLEIVEDQQILLIGKSNKLMIMDLAKGTLIAELDVAGLQRILNTQDKKLVFLTSEAIFTLPSSSLQFKNLDDFKNLIKEASTGSKSHPMISITGRNELFPLHGFKESTDQKSHVLLYTAQSENVKYSFTILDTNNLEVTNKFDSPHWWYDPKNVHAIRGTNLIQSRGGDTRSGTAKIIIVDAIASRFGYPMILKTISEDLSIGSGFHIGSTSKILISHMNTVDISSVDIKLMFKFAEFCAFKNCTSCKNLDSCDACVEGLEWNAEEKKCSVRYAKASLY